jgi:hypothetical protein
LARWGVTRRSVVPIACLPPTPSRRGAVRLAGPWGDRLWASAAYWHPAVIGHGKSPARHTVAASAPRSPHLACPPRSALGAASARPAMGASRGARTVNPARCGARPAMAGHGDAAVPLPAGPRVLRGSSR